VIPVFRLGLCKWMSAGKQGAPKPFQGGKKGFGAGGGGGGGNGIQKTMVSTQMLMLPASKVKRLYACCTGRGYTKVC